MALFLWVHTVDLSTQTYVLTNVRQLRFNSIRVDCEYLTQTVAGGGKPFYFC